MKAHFTWIDGPWLGKIAVLPRPSGGDWLDDEMQSWQDAGAGAVASFLVEEEAASLDLADESTAVRDRGMDFLSFPIVDRSVPSSPTSVGVHPELAFQRIAEARGVDVPETSEQREWVARFAAQALPLSPLPAR